MAEHPKVFISYSHDTPEHKQWVSELAAKLRRQEVDVIFDQWHFRLDDDITQFMERSIKDSDRVLVVCTDSYVREANAGEGGVGYEPMIVTRKLVEDLGINKFILIVRQALGTDKTPAFLGTQVYTDFTDEDQFDENFHELLHERLQVPDLQKQLVPHIESLRVRNYRALRDVELKGITSLSVFLGPNGSGKSTLFDVFAFLAECFKDGLRSAWTKREHFKELRTRGSDGPIEFELKYREIPKTPLITYHLTINEGTEGPYVETEWLQWRRGSRGRPFRFLNFEGGKGHATPGEIPVEGDKRINEQLNDLSTLAVSRFGQSALHPRVSALYRFVTGWHFSHFTTDATRSIAEAGPQEKLSKTGNNLPNVIQYLKERYPERLEKILSILSDWVPCLEKVDTELMMDGRLLLQIKDTPFEKPISAKFASDGTLKMLSFLALLYAPDPPQLIGVEEPENYLHPRLLNGLVEEYSEALGLSQLMITTHSPHFVNELSAEEVWVLYRDEQGFTVCKRASEMQGIKDFLEAGAQLGYLWMEGFFEVGDPLTNAGGPKRGGNAH